MPPSPRVLGIAFIGGEGPSPEQVRGLVPPGALIVAADSGLEAAERAGIAPGWIIGDMDSLDRPERLDAYPPERVLRCPPDKDQTDTEMALSLLWEKGCTETWLLGGGGGRMDHLLALRALFEREKAPDRWLTRREDIRRLEGGEALEATGLGKEALVSLFPLGQGPWAASSTGLHWPLGGIPWDRGSAWISNRAPTGACRIRALEGRFLVLLGLSTN